MGAPIYSITIVLHGNKVSGDFDERVALWPENATASAADQARSVLEQALRELPAVAVCAVLPGDLVRIEGNEAIGLPDGFYRAGGDVVVLTCEKCGKEIKSLDPMAHALGASWTCGECAGGGS